MESSAQAESLIPSFKLEKILNQDQAGRRVTILGNIDSKPSILTIERAALPSDAEALQVFLAAFTEVSNLDANDIYAWYLAKLDSSTNPAADLKLNLIHPCTETHIKKYSPQTVRMVTETADIYAEHIRPYMQQKRDQGRLRWVFNIIEGRTEQDAIILRSSHDLGKDEAGFLLLPDMNWDRTTMNSLRILGLVERRDLWSLRDLRKKDVPWLKAMMAAMTDAIVNVYAGEVEKDGLKVYVHYQPTYYHFHIHIVSVAAEPNATQAVGKAFSLPNLVSQLESMAGGPDAGFDKIDLTYAIGDASELWTEVFLPLKEGKKAA